MASATVEPSSVASTGGWEGLDYRASCVSACYPADPSVATGNSYVVELSNGAYRVWTTNGTLVLNATLGALFGSGPDLLSAPQLRYDASTLRWIASVEDVSKDQIYFAGSSSSDPTKSWYVQHFNPGGGDAPTQPLLGVDSVNVVITTNLFKGATFAGAQVWVANKTQLLSGAAVSAAATSPNATEESFAPAEPVQATNTLYLVSDLNGGPSFDAFTITGSPPGATYITGPWTYASSAGSPPPASQLGTASFVNTGDARVQSAVWNSGTLWASGTASCTPAGDSTPRACLHFWEVSTKTNSLLLSFNWTTGPGTYDYLPAIATDTAGNLATVFEESSSQTYPSVMVTAHAVSDLSGSMEPAFLVKAGTGPDNTTSECTLGVCPFGNYSSAAVSPVAGGEFWVAGEFSGGGTPVDPWHTWVGLILVTPTYPVVFTETGLPTGTSWSVTVNGANTSSNTTSIALAEPSGAYSFSVTSPIANGSQSRFVAAAPTGTLTVGSGPVSVPVRFVQQFAISASVSPAGAGSVSPSQGWFNASSELNLTALAFSGHSFSNWVGTGAGSYTGTADPAELTVLGPLAEQARFSTATTYTLTVAESGLPDQTSWTVAVNGMAIQTSNASATFYEPNGTYSFSVGPLTPASPGTEYLPSPGSGSFAISGSPVGESVVFATEYELTTSYTPTGEGSVEPGGGWYGAGFSFNLSALATPGYDFISWEGTGAGNYTGSHDPAVITMRGPIAEVAEFSTAGPSAVTPPSSPGSSGSAGMVPFWEFLLALDVLIAIVAILSVVLYWRRRRARPPSPSIPPAVAMPPPPRPTAPAAVAPPAPPPEPWREG